MVDPRDVGPDLGEELFSLVEAVGVPLIDVTPLAAKGYPGYNPKSYRLRFLDGSTLKGRRFGRSSRLAAVEYVLSHWRGDVHDATVENEVRNAFPRTVAQSNNALLTEWIEGRPLDQVEWTTKIVKKCGALHGRMHNAACTDGGPFNSWGTIDQWSAHLEQTLETIVAAGALDETDGKDCLRLAFAHSPRQFQVGFTHRDFCAENIVVEVSGALRIVDNETLAVDAYDYDLARTWYRWRMRLSQRRAYFEAYARHRSVDAFAMHFPFWAVAALFGSAAFRIEKGMAAAAVEPIDRLRGLLSGLRSGMSCEQAILSV